MYKKSQWVAITYSRQVVPCLNETLPQRKEGAAPPRQKNNQLGQHKHVADGIDEVNNVLRHIVLEATQPGLEQDGRDAWNK